MISKGLTFYSLFQSLMIRSINFFTKFSITEATSRQITTLVGGLPLQYSRVVSGCE